MPKLRASELILNTDGSIYHLHLIPEQLASTIITVGDPERVNSVTQYFDSIAFEQQKREFKTVTGTYKNKAITVISTGIGTDNVDIVLNELDALVNIDFKTKTLKEQHTALNIIRIGTSGAIQPAIPLDSFIVNDYAIGLDGLLHFYDSKPIRATAIEAALKKHSQSEVLHPYCVAADPFLLNAFKETPFLKGITATNAGFYGPQGRSLRLDPYIPDFTTLLSTFSHEQNGQKLTITNLEMETAGIYGLAKLLGHRAISLNAILANRALGTFSHHPQQVIDELICLTLDHIITLPE